MRALLFILLPFIIFNVDLTQYSIITFIDSLKQSGYYEVIRIIKIQFGDDIAIAICKEFVQSNDCETVVTTYMEEETIPVTKSGEIGLIDILCQEENLEVINQSYTIKEMKAKVTGILKKQLLSFESNPQIKENIKNILINLDKCY